MSDTLLNKATKVLYDDPHASMEMIAESIGIARSTLYRHFETRDALILAVSMKDHQFFIESMVPIMAEDIPAKDKFIKFMQKFVKNTAYSEILIHNTGYRKTDTIKNNFQEKSVILGKLLNEMKAEGSVHPNLSEEWFITTMKHIFYATVESIKKGDVARNTAVENLKYMMFFNSEQK